MPLSFGRHIAAAVVAYFLLSPGEAHAKFFLITTGETVSDLSSAGGGVSVAYKYDYAGLFWIDFWTWGGEFCLHQGQRYQPISKEQAAQLLNKSSVSPPFLYRFPLGLLILGGFAVLSVIGALTKKRGGSEGDGSGYERAE